MSRSHVYSRPKKDAEETLLGFLARKFTYLTADRWKAHLAAGHVAVNEVPVTEGLVVLKQHDTIRFSPPRSLEPRVDEEHIASRYQDEFIAVWAKNGDLPVTEGGRYCQNTLVGVLHRRLEEAEEHAFVAPGGVSCVEGSSTAETRKREREHGTPSPSAPPAETQKSQSRYFPVHRLDKETSGLVVLARSAAIANTLRKAFEAQSEALSRWVDAPTAPTLDDVEQLLSTKTAVQKVYLTLLSGAAGKGKTFLVHSRIAPIAEHPVLSEKPEHQTLKKLKMTCVPWGMGSGQHRCGKPALSRIRILDSSETLGLSLARVDILTGRSHQIRVHCADIGFPVLGDKMYTTSSPRVAGGGHAVDDADYLARVRQVDEATGHVAFSSDYLQPQWECRRHCLHAAALSFTHPARPSETVSFYEAPREWFLRDIRCRPDAEAPGFLLEELEALLRTCDAE